MNCHWIRSSLESQAPNVAFIWLFRTQVFVRMFTSHMFWNIFHKLDYVISLIITFVLTSSSYFHSCDVSFGSHWTKITDLLSVDIPTQSSSTVTMCPRFDNAKNWVPPAAMSSKLSEMEYFSLKFLYICGIRMLRVDRISVKWIYPNKCCQTS